MESKKAHMVTLEASSLKQEQSVGRTLSDGIHDFNLQCLRILRCTANAMANSPGGLRFKAGTRPWLEGISVGRPVLATRSGRRLDYAALSAND